MTEFGCDTNKQIHTAVAGCVHQVPATHGVRQAAK